MLDSYETIFGRANVHVKTGNGRDTGERLRFIQSGFLSFFVSFFFSAGAAVGIVVAMVAAGITFLWGEQAGWNET